MKNFCVIFLGLTIFLSATCSVDAPTDGASSSGSPQQKIVIAVASGFLHSLAVTEDATIWVTGWNNFGQLGTGDIMSREKWTKVLP